MGRETKILLALLATLAGVFLGVLSMKLLVPRPPAGAGPDVHLDLASTGENELVEPPSLSPPTPGPAAEEPAFVATEPTPPPPPPLHYADREPAAEDLLSPPAPLATPSNADVAEMPPTAAFAPPQPAPPPVTTPRRDPFVSPAGLEMEAPRNLPPTTDSTPAAVAYVANPGDSWWDLAERAYGDGRLYRALFAWNRVIDPRISLEPGTQLQIPPRPKLEAAWPKLMPAD